MKRSLLFAVTLLLLAPLVKLHAVEIDWDVLSSGGTNGSSGTLQLSGTVSQTAVGGGTSGSIDMNHGFWQDFGSGSPEFVCGDGNGSGAVDIDDVVYLIQYIFGGGPAPDPIESGDGNCSGFIDIDDVVYLIQYIFNGGHPPCDTDGNGVPDC